MNMVAEVNYKQVSKLFQQAEEASENAKLARKMASDDRAKAEELLRRADEYIQRAVELEASEKKFVAEARSLLGETVVEDERTSDKPAVHSDVTHVSTEEDESRSGNVVSIVTVQDSDEESLEVVPEEVEWKSVTCGSDHPKPKLPLTASEVSALHERYLDHVDGPYPTREQLERFEIERLKNTYDDRLKHRYQCVMCGEDSRFDAYDCVTYGGVVVCKPHGSAVFRLMADQGYHSFIFKGGQKSEVGVVRTYLGQAFKDADSRRRTDADADALLMQENLHYEKRTLGKLRGEIKVFRIQKFGEDQQESAQKDVQDRSLGFQLASLVQSVDESTMLDQVEHVLADLMVPELTEDELGQAVSTQDFRALLYRYDTVRVKIISAYVEAGFDVQSSAIIADQRWKEATTQLKRVHLAWHKTNKVEHVLFKEMMELVELLDLHSEYREYCDNIGEGELQPVFEGVNRMKKLMSKPAVRDAASAEMAERSKREQKAKEAQRKSAEEEQLRELLARRLKEDAVFTPSEKKILAKHDKLEEKREKIRAKTVKRKSADTKKSGSSGGKKKNGRSKKMVKQDDTD